MVHSGRADAGQSGQSGRPRQSGESEHRSHSRQWDLVVVGGGTAGLVAARTAASFGSRVLLIEEERLGGDCLWTGCVPSKSLIAAASAASTARGSTHLGVTATGITVDFAAVMTHVHGAMQTIAPDDSAESLEQAGVDVMHGRAVFTSDGELEVGERGIRFHQAFIATGGSPSLPEVPGVDAVDVLTSTTFWNLTHLPERLLVLGGGAIGCEIAQAMARLGSEVTLVHRGARILPKEDEKASAIVAAALIADGVTLLLERSLASFEVVSGAVAAGEVAEGEVAAGEASAPASDVTASVPASGGTAILDDGSIVEFDAVLAAIGRRPNTAGLGLDTVGVHLDDRGNVRVDDRLRTTNPRIWAAGDVSGLPQFTHTAGVNGSVGATNAVLGIGRSIDRDAVPRVTFTHPEVGAVGIQPSAAADRGLRVITIEHHELDRAICDTETSGYTSLVVDSRGRIKGGVIVGPRAGESLGELGVAVKRGLTASDLAGVTHAYPTYSDGVWKAAVYDVRRRVVSGAFGTVTGLLHSVRRRRVR